MSSKQLGMKRISVGSKLFMFENVYYVLFYVMFGILLFVATITFVRRKTEVDDVSDEKKLTDGINLLYKIIK